jgi:hypothetical protein
MWVGKSFSIYFLIKNLGTDNNFLNIIYYIDKLYLSKELLLGGNE